MNRYLKILCCVVVSLLTLPSASAKDRYIVERDSMVLLSRMYYKVNQTYPNDEQRDKLYELGVLMKCDSTIRIKIFSFCDKSGSAEINEYVSRFRATNVIDYLCNTNFIGGRIDRSRFEFKSEQVDSLASSDGESRRIEIYKHLKFTIEELHENIALDSAEIESVVTEFREREEQVVATKILNSESVEEEVEQIAVDKEYNIQHFSLRSNLLYLCAGMLNAGVEWRPGRGRWGLMVNGGYSPFANQDWEHNLGGYFVSPEIRVYMGGLRRGYLGVQGIVSGYNVKLDETGYQGDLYGAGVSGGYRTKLSKSLEIDFTLAFGAVRLNYGTYRIIYNGMSLYEDYDVEKDILAPLQVGVSLIWGRR